MKFFFVFAALLSASASYAFKPVIVYQTDKLIITRLSENVFEHTTFLSTQDFGNVPCNGMIVRDGEETIVFDTTVDDETSEALIEWITNSLNCSIKALVVTHFHIDCLGGIAAFSNKQIPSYAHDRTIGLAVQNGFQAPDNGFHDSLTLTVGNKIETATFFGEGHTRDNIVVYFPSEKALFGGCLIKELKAGKGNLSDANEKAWSETVRKIKTTYPDVTTVIPGHGKTGTKKLLDYTIRLFED